MAVGYDKPHTDRHCQAIASSGKPCPSWHRKESQFCITHDPEVPQELKDSWHRAAGLGRAAAINGRTWRLKTPKRVVDFCEKMINEISDSLGLILGSDKIIDLLKVMIVAQRDARECKEAAREKKNSYRLGWRAKGTG